LQSVSCTREVLVGLVAPVSVTVSGAPEPCAGPKCTQEILFFGAGAADNPAAMRLAKGWLPLTLNLLLLFGCTQSQKPTGLDVRLETPAFTIDAASLWNEYQTNAVAADQKYKGKVLVVSGPIYGIHIDGFLGIQLGKNFPTVQCSLAKWEKSATLPEKDVEVTIKGRLAGKVQELMTLEGCYFQHFQPSGKRP